MSGGAYPGIDNLEVLEVAVRYNRFLVDLIVSCSLDSPRAIDYGAGTGTLSATVRERGLDVDCVEPDPRLARQLRDKGFRVVGDLTTIPDGTADYIYSINVLEHIAADEAALAQLRSNLSGGGRLLLYVPAFPLLFSSMDRKVGHHRRYRMSALREVVERIGFNVERMEYADCLGFFVTLLYRVAGSRRGDISKSSVRAYDRLVFPVSRLLDRAGASRILGKNLVACLTRADR